MVRKLLPAIALTVLFFTGAWGQKTADEIRREYEKAIATQKKRWRTASPGDWERSKVRYVFRKRQQLFYAVKIQMTNGNRTDYWAGAIRLATKSPTPLRSDGSGYNTGTVLSAGQLQAFTDHGLDKFQRAPGSDLQMPEEIIFAPSGVKRTIGDADNDTLPASMSICYTLVEAIFPKAPLQEGVSENPISQQYFVSRGGVFNGGTSGKGVVRRSVSGPNMKLSQVLQIGESTYQARQSARFDTKAKIMMESRTTFLNGRGERVDIKVRRISAAQARQAMSAGI